MNDDYDINWMSERASQVILAAVDGEGERVADLLGEIGGRFGDHGMYGLCCALAEAVVRMEGYERGGSRFYGFEVRHQDRGVVAPEDADDEVQDMMAAMRFVSAYLNRDSDQTLALFHSPQTPEEAVLLPIGLVKLVGATGRWKLEQTRGSNA